MKYLVICLLLLNVQIFADDFFEDFEFDIISKLDYKIQNDFNYNSPSRSKVHQIMKYITSVKSQGKRGACSIFSSTALLESELIRRGLSNNSINLSEEWLEYLAVRNKVTEGSNDFRNLNAYRNYGFVYESTWSYIPYKWEFIDDDPLAQIRCSSLIKDKLISCLLGHRNPDLFEASDELLNNPNNPIYDPEFIEIRNESFYNRDNLNDKIFGYRKKKLRVKSISEVRKLLNNNITLTLAIQLFYGAWNMKKAELLGIGKREKALYKSGQIGNPEPGSKDFNISQEKGRKGHSVQIIGYDDDVTIKRKVLMDNNEYKEFEYKGVYYFKNSWGSKFFGKNFEIDGIIYPGFGMLPQIYAHEFGRFIAIRPN